MLDFLFLALATWRITSLLVVEDGPLEVFARLRVKAGVRFDERSQPYAENLLGEMLLCVWCTSFWVGLGLTFLYLFTPHLFFVICTLPLALSACAIGLQIFFERDLAELRTSFSRWLDEAK